MEDAKHASMRVNFSIAVVIRSGRPTFRHEDS